jgi:trans-aconitate methyltransferase
MLNPKLYRSSRLYDFFFKSIGYQRSIERFLKNVPLEHPGPQRILDAGCGTGTLGLHFLARFPAATLVATDLEPNFLQTTLTNAAQRGIAADRITVGTSNISTPDQVQLLTGDSLTLRPGSFDLICVGAVVGYADDTVQSLRQLVNLLAPDGTLINIEMNESPTGRFVSNRYHYANIALSQMQQVLEEEGCYVIRRKLRLGHLPARFTREAVIARKAAAK